MALPVTSKSVDVAAHDAVVAYQLLGDREGVGFDAAVCAGDVCTSNFGLTEIRKV